MQLSAERFSQKIVLSGRGAAFVALASLLIVVGVAFRPNVVSAETFTQVVGEYDSATPGYCMAASDIPEGNTGTKYYRTARSATFTSLQSLFNNQIAGGSGSGGSCDDGEIFPLSSFGMTSSSTYDGYYFALAWRDDTIATTSYAIAVWQYDRDTNRFTPVLPDFETLNLQYDTTYNTRFLDVDTIIASTSPTTFSLRFDLDYFLDLAEIDASDSSRNLNGIRYQWSYQGSNSLTNMSFPLTVTAGTSSLTEVLSDFYGDFDDGRYAFQIGFTTVGSITSGFIFPRTLVSVSFAVANGVVSDYTETVTNGLAPRVSQLLPEEQECSISSIGGCIINAFQYVFYPSSDSVDAFFDSYELLQHKIPFVYVYQASDLLTGLYSGTSANVPTISYATDIGTITWISQSQVAAIPFVGTLRALMSAGLWLMLFTVLYRKTLSIHDTQTV